MAPASNEEQFKFLISCIRYSNNGKVDFGSVAQECKIVSKGAAAKRYERMMRAHGIAPNAASVKNQPASRTKTEQRDTHTGNGNVPNKKRKAEQFGEDNNTSVADEEEGFATNIKSDPTDDKSQLRVKEEEGQLSLDDATNLMQFYDTPSFQDSEFDAGLQDYGTTDYDGASSSGYHTPFAGSCSIQTPFDFSSPYGSGGMRSSMNIAGSDMGDVPPQYQSPYQSYVQYTPNTTLTLEKQGQSESPVIVE